MQKAIVVEKVPGSKPGKAYLPLKILETAVPRPGPKQLLIRITAAALNHRDLFIRMLLYPGISFTTPLLADGCGVVEATGSAADKSWKGKRVVLNPGHGWDNDLEGPEGEGGYKILGGTISNPNGTLQEWMVIDETQVEEAPKHLSDTEAAALPLTGLTAWRATIVKAGLGNIQPGKNVLITGIGGGVALMALLFAVGKGADVWVTSGEPWKIDAAVKLGAKGGVNYREKGWETKLLQKVGQGKLFDVIVDGAGGDVVEKAVKILKQGGVISSYGMTLAPKAPWLMQAVMRNIELKGSTMGSRKEFKEMVDFVTEKRLIPIVSRVVSGIENLGAIDSLFEDMKHGKQFGKLVAEIGPTKNNLVLTVEVINLFVQVGIDVNVPSIPDFLTRFANISQA